MSQRVASDSVTLRRCSCQARWWSSVSKPTVLYASIVRLMESTSTSRSGTIGRNVVKILRPCWIALIWKPPAAGLFYVGGLTGAEPNIAANSLENETHRLRDVHV